MININTKSYWDNRFSNGDWESKNGRNQTMEFAKSQVSLLDIPKDFSGSILDFGCGLGDAFPIYKDVYPNAKLIGLDLSEKAIEKCRTKYGEIAEFISGDYMVVPKVDIIITSNVFEHLSNDKAISSHLKKQCDVLYIVVPYREVITQVCEHVNSYDENSFKDLNLQFYKIFITRGYSQYGFSLLIDVHLKNILRPLIGRRMVKRSKQILMKFT